MQPCACDLADRPKAGHAGTPPFIRLNTAHVVMLGRCDRQRLRDRVETNGAAALINCRERLGETGANGLPAIEKRTPASGNLAKNGTCDDVAWGKLGIWV